MPLYPGGPSEALGNDSVGDDNLRAASYIMELSDQEKALYKRHLKNLTGSGGVDNEDGSRSSLYAFSVGIDDKTYMLPSVWKGKILPQEEAIKMAEKEGLDKFPSYDSQEEAAKRYKEMHEYMDKDTKRFLDMRRR